MTVLFLTSFPVESQVVLAQARLRRRDGAGHCLYFKVQFAFIRVIRGKKSF